MCIGIVYLVLDVLSLFGSCALFVFAVSLVPFKKKSIESEMKETETHRMM